MSTPAATEAWGQRIKELRGDRRQEDIAALAGIHQTMLSLIERGGVKALDPAVMERIATALGVEPSEIWNWIEDAR